MKKLDAFKYPVICVHLFDAGKGVLK